MYVYTQDMQQILNDGVVIPEITDRDSFDDFRSEANTLKLLESDLFTIAESKI